MAIDDAGSLDMRAVIEEILKEHDLFDETYFWMFFSGDDLIPLAQTMVRTILERDDITIREAHVEHTLDNAVGRSIRLDLWAVDESDAVFDIEMQSDPSGANPQRARYYSSLLDAKNDLTGVDARALPKRLPPTHVIFVTRTDVLKEGLPIYHISRVVEETGRPFGDGSHIIYVNGAHKDTTTPLGRLVHDLICAPAAMKTDEFAKRAMYLHADDEEGKMKMSPKLQEMFAKRDAQIRAEGRNEGRAEGTLSTLVGLVRKGLLSIKDAAENLSMPEAVFVEKMEEYLRTNQ